MHFPLEKAVFLARNGRVSPLKKLLHSDTLYMEKQSFREILAQFLEEKTDNSPLKNTVSPLSPPTYSSVTPLLSWQSPSPRQNKNGYPPPATRPTRFKPTTPPVEKELIYAVGRLETPDRLRVQALERMGATEFSEGVSLKRLKKAHRRLVKHLHPDHLAAGSSADEVRRHTSQFLLLQEAYEGLQRTLNILSASASGSTGDSESASAPTSQPRAAA